MLNKAYEMSYQSGLLRNSVLDEFMSYHDVKQIACGEYHTFILKNDGSVWSCGNNGQGQLGLGDTTNRTTFTQVTTNINNDVKQIACGRDHTIIIKNDGSIWGCGASVQLGLGDTVSSYTFTQVTTNINYDVKQIACGRYYTFILKNDGSVWSCGRNGQGYLGLGDNTNRNTFTKVTTNINNDVKQIACGNEHTFILKNDGSVWSCGASGQLGLGDTTNKTTFTQVTTNINNDVKQIACVKYHTFILKNDGSIWGCGLNTYGELGLGDTTNRTTFTQVTTNINNDVKQVVCGIQLTFILKNDGSVWACGFNSYGSVGLGDTTNRTTFTQVTTNINNDVKQIACGDIHTFILKNDGSVYSCGNNGQGQLGLGNTTNRNIFVAHNFSNVKKIVFDGSDEMLVMKSDGSIYDGNGCKMDYQVACGYNHTFILKNDGSLWSCGNNGQGQLGLGDYTDRNTFTQVTTNINNDVKQLACGYSHTFILKNDGSIWGWGNNAGGALGLGDNTNRNTFTQVTTNINNDVKEIACGDNRTFILKNDGSIWGCGYNYYGELGLGDTTSRNTFTKVTTNVNDIKQIVGGGTHTFILKNDGSIWSCGKNDWGQLGLGTSDTNAHSTFTKVTTNINNDVKEVSCGTEFTFILKNDGSVYSCGGNGSGQLGLGDTASRPTFTKVTTNINNDVKQIACGNGHTVILKNDGSVYSCGGNGSGQLGIGIGGANTNKSTFTKVTTNINNDVKQIACGNGHTVILKNDGSVLSCGNNVYGQLGLGDTASRNMFIQTNSYVITTDINYKDIFSYNNKYIVNIPNNVCVDEIMKACDIGINHALFINNSNNLVIYATSNDYGQAGKDTELNTFVNHPSLTDVKLIACGDYSSYVYTHNDELYVFGKNDGGQLGLGGTDNESEPILIPNITGVKKMIAQGSTCIILLNDGTLLGVGENSQGQFGLGDSNPRNIFTQIATNVEEFWYNQRTLVYYSDNFVYGVGNNNCNKLCAGTDVSVVETPLKLLYTPGMKTVAIGNNKLILVLASNSTPIVNYVSKAIPNFEFLLYDEDLVSCEVYLNDELLRTINDELTTQTQIVVIPEEDIVTGTNNIKIIVEDSDGNVATSITRFDKNPLNIEEGCSLIYKGKKYVVTGVSANGDNTDLQLNKALDIAAVEGDNLRIFNDNIEVKCECDGSGNNIDMELVGIQETNRNTIKETYELEVDCRTFAPNIKINKSTGSTKISRISVNCTYKED